MLRAYFILDDGRSALPSNESYTSTFVEMSVHVCRVNCANFMFLRFFVFVNLIFGKSIFAVLLYKTNNEEEEEEEDF